MPIMLFKGAKQPTGLVITLALSIAFYPLIQPVQAADNLWNNTGGGSWENPANWSLGLAPTNTDAMYVTNNGTYTVNIDNTTANTGSSSTWLTVSNLTVGASSGSPVVWINFTNEARTFSVNATIMGAHQKGSLIVNNGTVVGRIMTVGTVAGSHGSLEIFGGSVRLTNNAAGTFTVGEQNGSTGVVVVAGGALLVTNTSSATSTTIGSAGYGEMTVSNGMLQTKRLVLGETATGVGTMSILQGGTVIMSGAGGAFFHLGRTGTGTIVVDGGLLRTTNSATFEISRGANLSANGTLIVSNGFTEFSGATTVIGGSDFGGDGKWLIYGGTNRVTSPTFLIANNASTSPNKGLILLNGGLLDASSVGLTVASGTLGNGTVRGTVIVSNGIFLVKSVAMGGGAKSLAQWNIVGGTSAISSNVAVGSAVNSTGTVVVTGGNLFVTNATNTATIEIGVLGVGAMAISNGTVTADRFVATNGANSALTFAGGILNIKSLTISNNSAFVIGNGMGSAVLNLNGTMHSAADGLVLNTNATLSGTGFSTLTLGGNLSLASNSTVVVDLMTNSATGYDRAIVTGAVSLAESILSLRVTNFTAALGSQFTIIDNDGTLDPVVGTFASLTNNALIDKSFGGQDIFFRILYDDGDGNDVVLLVTVPEPSATALCLLAAGGIGLLRQARQKTSFP